MAGFKYMLIVAAVESVWNEMEMLGYRKGLNKLVRDGGFGEVRRLKGDEQFAAADNTFFFLKKQAQNSLSKFEYYYDHLKIGGILSGACLSLRKKYLNCIGCLEYRCKMKKKGKSRINEFLIKHHPYLRLYTVKDAWYIVKPRFIYATTKKVSGKGILAPGWSLGFGGATKLRPHPFIQTVTTHQKKSKDLIVSIAFLYYQDSSYLSRQLKAWSRWPLGISKRFEFLIIDDGSPEPSKAKHYISSTGNLNIHLYEIQEDMNWNIGGARNLAVYLAKTNLILFLDADILMTPTLARRILRFSKQPKTNKHWALIDFPRILNGETNVSAKPHPAVSLIPKNTYWHVGGCDEDFVGNYGVTDVHFKWRLQQTLDTQVITADNFPPLYMLSFNHRSPRSYRNATLNKKLFIRKKHASSNSSHLHSPSSYSPWAIDFLRFSWKHIPLT